VTFKPKLSGSTISDLTLPSSTIKTNLLFLTPPKNGVASTDNSEAFEKSADGSAMKRTFLFHKS